MQGVSAIKELAGKCNIDSSISEMIAAIESVPSVTVGVGSWTYVCGSGFRCQSATSKSLVDSRSIGENGGLGREISEPLVDRGSRENQSFVVGE